MDRITVTPLGTSAGTPTRERNVASFLIELDGRALILDCGEGTQHRLIENGWKPNAIEAIVITHLHGDHVYGLPGLLSTMSMMGRPEPLSLYGPPGLARFVDSVRSATQLSLAYELHVNELDDGATVAREGYSIRTSLLVHCIPCLGYAIVEDDRPGRFDVDRAISLGVPPGRSFGALQAGSDVTLADGRVVRSRDVVGPPRRGRRIVYCTDTRACDAAVRLAAGADLLIHEATYGDDMAEQAAPRFHATAREAAGIAAAARVDRLLLTHFSPRYLDLEVLAAQAREVFDRTTLARELTAVDVPKT